MEEKLGFMKMEHMSGNQNRMKELDFSKTKDYFIDHIESQCILGKMITQNIAFHKGQFYILLPKEAKLKRLYEFSLGGVNPVISTNEIHDIDGTKFVPNTRITTFLEVSEFIKQFLDLDGNHIAIFEDAIRSKGNPHIDLPHVGLHFYEDQVYYSLSSKNSVKEIYNIVRRTDSIWHSLIVLANLGNLSHELKTEEILVICNSAQYIITSAHDSENCIFWAKS